jgi:hypothetical protein
MTWVSLLPPCTGWAEESTASAGKSRGSTYLAESPPADYLQRTSWLWGFEGEPPPAPEGLFFNFTRGSLREQAPDPYDSWPTILVRLPEGWRVVDFREKFFRYMWSHAAAAPGKGYFWGFLEYSVEDAGDELPLIRSTDGGRTWAHVATLKKPDREATLESFEMDAKGRGELQVVSRRGAASGTRKVFTFLTTDWGKTWRLAPSVKVSVLKAGRVPPGDVPCWVAVRNLPEPLLEACRFPVSVYRQVGGASGSSPQDGTQP